MIEHEDFDEALERYEVFNNGDYDRQLHLSHVRSIVRLGERLMYALGEPEPLPVPTETDTEALEEAALWALEYFDALDRANATIHCAIVRYSPITMRLAQALASHDHDAVRRVIAHVGAYDLDPGR